MTNLQTNLQKYAQFLASIREFFNTQNTLEVSTKSLLNSPTLDCNIDSIKIQANPKFKQKTYFLHTSPELEMKKLLANGSGDIYQICKVYRDNEIGAINFNEFSMLEYYLLGVDEIELSENVLKLLNFVGISGEVVRFSYTQLFEKWTDFDINSNFKDLKNIAKQHHLATDFDNIADLQALLFVHFVEDKLKQFDICIIYDYPQAQSALAKVENGASKRFEMYLQGVEIANGYKELTTAKEYSERFLEQSGVENTEFTNSLTNPLPNCSGVALGLNRIFNAIQ